MTSLFDFLYYYIFKFYAGYHEKGAQSSSAGIVGGFQAINILTLLFLIGGLTNRKLASKTLTIILVIFFQITTYIRYIYRDNNSVGVIEKKLQSKTDSAQSRILSWLWFYGIVSIVACFGLAIYFGSQR